MFYFIDIIRFREWRDWEKMDFSYCDFMQFYVKTFDNCSLNISFGISALMLSHRICFITALKHMVFCGAT